MGFRPEEGGGVCKNDIACERRDIGNRRDSV